MSNIYEHPMLAIQAGIAAARDGGSLLDIIKAIETCWALDIAPTDLQQAMKYCKKLEVERSSINRFYKLICILNPIYINQKHYTMAELSELDRQVQETITESELARSQPSTNGRGSTGELLITAIKNHALKRDFDEAYFQLIERDRYHRFWPATEITDVLETTFVPEDDPGRIIGQYLRAIFESSYPQDENLGIFYRESSPQNSRSILSTAKQLALIVRDSEILEVSEREALDALLAGEIFGGINDFDVEQGRLQALRLATAAAGVKNQYLFTTLAFEAHTSSYLETHSLGSPENDAVARCLLLAFLFGTHERSRETKLEAIITSADIEQRHAMSEVASHFHEELRDSWTTLLARVAKRTQKLRNCFVRFPPQFLFRFVNWGNAAIGEISQTDHWVSRKLLPFHLSSATRYSESRLQGRAYFRWEDTEHASPILENALSALETRAWSITTLIAFIESHTFWECYRGKFVNDQNGHGEFEREIAERCFRDGFPRLGAAFAAFFLVAHTFQRGYLPETLKWVPIIEDGLATGARKSVVQALTYAIETARNQGNDLNALRLEGLVPSDETIRSKGKPASWRQLAAPDAEDTIQNMKSFLQGIDPRELLDEESLRQWVDAHRIEAVIRSEFGARGLESWIAPGHGYHAAMESTLRERLRPAYFHPDYKAFKKEVGELDSYKKQPSLDHLICLLRDANRSETVQRLLNPITSLHKDSTLVSRLESLNQQSRTRTGHGKAFSQQHMGKLLELLFGRESLFRDVLLNLQPHQ